MPTLTFRYSFLYYSQPVIQLAMRSSSQRRPFQTYALVDTGAEISLFDVAIARELGLHLMRATSVAISGVGGLIRDGLLAEVTVQLLGERNLSTTVDVAFAPDVEVVHGNLLGLDVLQSFRFALSHGERIGYFDRAP